MVEVIAECCQNHNGDIAVLEEMVHQAAAAGATYAKIQSMQAVEELTHRPRFDEGVVRNGVTEVIKRPFGAELERLRKLDLSDEQHRRFLETCRAAGIKPMTTVFTRARIPFVASLGLDTIKVASFDCASFPMLRELRAAGPHRIIVSTGVTFDEEVEQAIALLRDGPLAVLHCVSIYPTPLEEAHLDRLDYLRELCPAVGLSDHSNPERDGEKMSAAGLLKGARIIEKHFTVLPKDKTRDGPVSANFEQLKRLVELSRLPPDDLRAYVRERVPEYETMLGDRRRALGPTELLNRDYYRGRFASRTPQGEWIYNWEERLLA